MYKNLNVELARLGWNIIRLSEETGIKYQTLVTKMKGNSEFKFDGRVVTTAGRIPFIVPVPVVIFAVWRRDFYDFHNHLSCHILQFLKKIHFLSHSVFLFIQNLFSIYSLS